MFGIIFYISFFIIVFLFSTIGTKYYEEDKIKGKIFIFISFIILLLLIGLRYNVGTDYESYLRVYKIIRITPWNQLNNINMELGCKVLFKLISTFSKNDYIIFIFTGFLTIYPIYKLNKVLNYKYLPYSILTFCMLFLPFCLNGIRQGIALSFLCLSFTYLYKKEYKKTIISFVTGFLFHKSSLLFLPYEILYIIIKEKKYRKYSIMITIIISIAILFFFKDLMNVDELEKYTYLLKKISVENISLNSLFFYTPILIITLIYKQKTTVYNILQSLFIDGIILHIVGTSAQFFYRISLYFTTYQIILIPYIIQNIKTKNSRITIKMIYIIYLIIYFVYFSYICGKHEIFPYDTWITK